MPRVNLLPWREERRRRLKRGFMLALLGAGLAGGLVACAGRFALGAATARQDARNAVLRAEIAALDRQTEAILGLEAEKERLLARMRIIDRLQRSRPEAVHLFDELVATLPDSVRLTAVTQSGLRMRISGVAQSTADVSALMRNIDESEWLGDPGLDRVELAEDGAARNAVFTILARQIPTADASGASEP